MPVSVRPMKFQKRWILAQLAKQPFHPAKAGLIGGLVVLLATAAAFGTAPGSTPVDIPRTDVTQEIPNAVEAVTATAGDNRFAREDRIRTGDTVEALIAHLGVTETGIVERLRLLPQASGLFRQLSPGKPVSAVTNGNGELLNLTFPLNGSDRAVQFIRSEAGVQVEERPIGLEIQSVMKSAEIRYSLFGATDAAGIPDTIATQLADIFGGDIDFHRDLRKGDRFSVSYEVVQAHGKPVRTGRILATEFINNGKTYRAVWFGTEDGKGGYYTPEGKSLRKAFLRSPLEFSRVTSGFSTSRFHPVLQTWRAHKGVDYGAAVGTRVRATADGVVEFAGVQGGYGKVLILRHQGRYSTVYGHLSAFAKGLKAGSRVSQGDIIAFSGVSGLASGPHLHYEFRVDGVHQNPLTVALPGSPPLPPQQMGSFRQRSQLELARIELIRGSNLSLLD